MAFSGSQITALQPSGTPGRTRTFIAKTATPDIIAKIALKGSFHLAQSLKGSFQLAQTLKGKFVKAVSIKGKVGD